jgi:peroxiredoxin
MSINFEGNYGPQEMWSAIDGYELYTKNNGEYTLFNTIEGTTYTRVEVNLGESKTYVARVYVLDENGQKVYSDYSNEVVVDNSKILAPTLTDVAGGVPGTEVMSRNLFINAEGNYVEEEALSAIDGFILYEKINGVYRVSCEVSGADRVGVDVPLGESKIYAVKVYVLDENGQKVYSDYSNEVVIDNTNMQ